MMIWRPTRKGVDPKWIKVVAMTVSVVTVVVEEGQRHNVHGVTTMTTRGLKQSHP